MINKKQMLLNIFRLLYCTGLRISECLNIKIKDVDFEEGSIMVRNTKNGRDRVIFISDSLRDELQKLNKDFNQGKFLDDYFFAKSDGNLYTVGVIYHYFRTILYYSGIKHTGHGPRVHDFRHTFCVYSFKKTIESGKDVNAYIPILATYLGHTSFLSTEYYLRLISELYPEIKKKVEKYTNDIIRKVESFDDKDIC